MKLFVLSLLLIVATTGVGLILYFTPVMSARSIIVTGIGAVSRDEVLDVAHVRLGTPLLQIHTDGVADRVAAIRRVASARVQRDYPSALRIIIVERIPLVVKDFPDGPHLFEILRFQLHTEALLQLDGVLVNARGGKMICCDTDYALALL